MKKIFLIMFVIIGQLYADVIHTNRPEFELTSPTEGQVLKIGSENKIVNVNVNEATQPKVYRAILTQSGTSAPVAVVLENTFGDSIVWTRNYAGDYLGILNGAFPADKTFVMMHGFWDPLEDLTSMTYGGASRAWNSNAIHVWSGTGIDTLSDDLLYNVPIEILVYP